MSNQKYNAMEVSQKKELLEKFSSCMASIVCNRGVMEYQDAKEGFVNLLKGKELINYPFHNTQYEDAWDVFLKSYFDEQENLDNLDKIVKRLKTVEQCNKLSAILEEHKLSLVSGKKENYYSVYSDGILGIFKTPMEATDFLSALMNFCVKNLGDDLFVERLSIYKESLYVSDYEEKLKKTRNNDMDYALAMF